MSFVLTSMDANREMPSDEVRTTNRILLISTFKIHISNFTSPASPPTANRFPSASGSSRKTKNADAKRGFRDRRKQTLFIDARKMGTLIDQSKSHGQN